jgi:hypothetical protein
MQATAGAWHSARQKTIMSVMSDIVRDSPSGYLVIQFLDWIAEAPRTYGQAMDAWRTSCPRLSIWEDSLTAGLICLDEGRWRDRRVALTRKGRIFLQSANASQPQGKPHRALRA